MKKNNETKVVCPNCGAEFVIPEHSHAAVGMVVGKDSNLGVIQLPVVNANNKQNKTSTPFQRLKVQERLDLLKQAGVNTDNLFAISSNGKEYISQLNDGEIHIVDEKDEIYKKLSKVGTIYNRRLFRRWVLAMIFAVMDDEQSNHVYSHYARGGLTTYINDCSFAYMLEMTAHEFEVQEKCFTNGDVNNFTIRHNFFDKDVAVAVCNAYLQALKDHVDSLRVLHCKKVPYKRIGSKNYFISDIQSKVYRPIQRIINAVSRAECVGTLAALMRELQKLAIRLPWDTPKPKEWINAYKGVGCYYAMENLIRFHNCCVFKNGKPLSTKKSLDAIQDNATQHPTEGYHMYGMLKELLKDNHIDIHKKRMEWRAARS